ncbi:10987_t:CDS:2 [Funneliformis mosseae]|uniref:10987_t:CDS:1 n=1 Tax=Funneliformis mosseae TaxID=27381 RepID=A0A9N9GS91_FUNMO|nr:10987_t:CDS:2 [Funneliformis mosseae]
MWKRRIWPVIKDLKITKNEQIKKMYKTYQINLILLHAQAIHFGNLAYLIWFKKLSRFYGYNFKLGIDHKISFYELFPWFFILQLYVAFIPKAIRDESHKLMTIIYIGNAYALYYIIENLYNYCSNNLLNEHLCGFKYFIQQDPWFQIVFVLSLIAIIIILLQTMNLIVCHRNFGNNLGFYLKYQDLTSEFESCDGLPIQSDPKDIE